MKRAHGLALATIIFSVLGVIGVLREDEVLLALALALFTILAVARVILPR